MMTETLQSFIDKPVSQVRRQRPRSAPVAPEGNELPSSTMFRSLEIVEYVKNTFAHFSATVKLSDFAEPCFPLRRFEYLLPGLIGIIYVSQTTAQGRDS